MLTQDSILSILEAIGCGGLMLDAKGRVLQTNEKARRYLGAELNIRHRGSPPSDAVSNERMQIALREAVRASTRVMPQLGNYITVPRGASRPLLLRRIFVPGQVTSDDDPTAAIIVLDMEDCPLPDEDLLRDVFLLTPAEIRLARKLSCGSSLGEIAEEIDVSIATLRVQLKTLFLKTGTSRQGELISLLAHLSRLNAER